MRNTTLIDSGPLIALFDRGDRHHERVKTFLKTYDGKLLTTWPVLTEVSHMLDFNLHAQLDFLRWVELGGVELYEIAQKELTEMIELMQKYSDIPMDLADASLMYIAHKEGIDTIVSIDSDFDIYRTLKKSFLKNLLRG